MVGRRRRALSYILSVVLMTLITTSLATVVLLWGLNEVSTSRNSFSLAIRARAERAQERLVVEDVYFDSARNTIMAYVRNSGGIQIVVDGVYLNHTARDVAAVKSIRPSGDWITGIGSKLSLPIQGLGVVNATVTGLAQGRSNTITVSTTRGSTVTGYWKYE